MPLFEKFPTGFGINSSKEFGGWFRKQIFCLNEMEYFSLDVKKLFPSVCTETLIDQILTETYDKNRAVQMLPRFRDKAQKLFPPIPKHLLKIMLTKTLTQFTALEFNGRYFRQCKGLGIGDITSPVLANFFLHNIEHEKIKKMKSEGLILHYLRYCDDCLIFAPKGSRERITRAFNEFHPSIKYELDLPEKGELKFLDFIIYESETSNNLEIKSAPKESVTMDAQSSIAPKNMKIGILKSEFIRAKLRNSENVELQKAYESLSNKFINLGYTPKTVEAAKEHAQEERDQTNKTDWAEEIKNNPERNHCLALPFTSQRVSKIAADLRKLVKTFTPEFNLRIAHKTLNVRNSIVANLYSVKDPLTAVKCVYEFQCVCPSSYIGETISMEARLEQHFQPSRENKPYLHITECVKYQKELRRSRIDPRSFFNSRFRVIERNLDYLEREKLEAVHIVLKDSDLNKQVQHANISFV